jgi:rod shape-determining protein MreC
MIFNNENNRDSEKQWLSIVIGIVLAIILLFFNRLGWLKPINVGISYIFDPIYSTSSNVALDIKEFFTTVTNISEFRKEYNEMKLQIAQYEITNMEYRKLEEENIDLKKQLELGNKEDLYLETEILDHIETEYMIINVGSQDGVSKGDIVVLGDAFIGIIIDVGQYTSKVRLPISKSSFLEAYILSTNEESTQKILSRAVVSGSSDGIRIENIGMNSGVVNGDVVMVNDSKVGENLVLGTVVALSEDPATTTRSGYVSPVVDYYDLINVFVRIEDAN